MIARVIHMGMNKFKKWIVKKIRRIMIKELPWDSNNKTPLSLILKNKTPQIYRNSVKMLILNVNKVKYNFRIKSFRIWRMIRVKKIIFKIVNVFIMGKNIYLFSKYLLI